MLNLLSFCNANDFFIFFELKARITEAVATIDNAMLERVWHELDYRLDVCRVTDGAHIEHL